MSDNLTVFDTDYTGVTGIKAHKTSDSSLLAYVRPQGTKSITANGTGIDVSAYATADVAVPSSQPVLQVKTRTISAAGTFTDTPDSGYDGLSSVQTTVPQGEIFVEAPSVQGEFYTQNNRRMWRTRSSGGVIVGDSYGTPGFIADSTWVDSVYNSWYAVPANTSVTPTESSQTIGGARYMMEGAVTVNAISSSYVGSGITRRSSSDLTASGNTVSVPAGYYESAASKAIAGGAVNMPSMSITANPSITIDSSTGLVSSAVSSPTNAIVPTITAGYVGPASFSAGNVAVSGSATSQLTVRTSSDLTVSGATVTAPAGYYSSAASKAVANGSVSASATKGTVSNHSVQVTPTATVGTAGYLAAGSTNGTAVTVQASELVSGSETKTSNGTYDVTNLAEIVVNVQGGGSTGLQVDDADVVTSTASSSIQFTGLNAEPTSFVISSETGPSLGSPGNVVAVVFDGTSLHGQKATSTSNANASYDTGFTKSYSNGTLTVTATNAQFAADWWFLDYTYGGGSIETSDVQVGSGATSISFTGLDDEPVVWSCIFKSNFGTSSGYQRVIFTKNNGTSIYGACLDSSVHLTTTYWTASYSNGTLTITSNSTNQGGYFHQPGYYQLTYALDTSGNYQSKTVDPSTSQQMITADSGYDALKRVTVNAMPSMTLPSAASATSSGTQKASITPTSSTQYINIPTGYNATAQYYAIAASGGGGTVNVATTTWSNSSNTATSHQFTGLSGTPKAAFLRCTSSLSRSSSSSNYFIADMVWNGTSCNGNSFRRSNGTYANVTSGYSVSVSGTSITFTSSGTSTTNPGSFYNGSYELVYVY